MKASASATASSATSSAAACCCIWSTAPASMPARTTRRCAHELDAYGHGLADKPEIVALSQGRRAHARAAQGAGRAAQARREEDAAGAVGAFAQGRAGGAARAARGDRRRRVAAARRADGAETRPRRGSRDAAASTELCCRLPTTALPGYAAARSDPCPQSPSPHRFPPHRRQGRLVAAGRRRGRARASEDVARLARRRHRRGCTRTSATSSWCRRARSRSAARCSSCRAAAASSRTARPPPRSGRSRSRAPGPRRSAGTASRPGRFC